MGVDDLNGDGYLDLVCANYGTSSGSDSQIYWGSSSGTWSDTGAKTLSTRWGRNAVTGGFNGDGERDFVIASSRQTGSTDSYVFLNKGGGDFGTQADVRITTAMSYDVDVGDLDKDGYDDIVFGEQGTSRCFLGGSSGPSTTPDISFPSGGITYDVLVYDIDLDGHLDVVFTNSDSSSASVYMGDSNGPDATVDYSLSVSTARSTGVSAGDINGDGYVDLVFSYSNKVKIYPGGASGWSDSNTRALSPSELCYSVECLDVDKDGYSDVISTCSGSSARKLEIFLGSASWPTGVDISKDGGSYARNIGVVVPKGGGLGYTGTFTTEPIDLPLDKKWDMLYLEYLIPKNTTVTLSVLDSRNESIAG
ncbi:MAG: VCBS repeat-containing protein, partial [Thermoplasmata archaeon]|nr:VCBS repeat-containing protein [Thermoplasmata archaeon]